MCYFLDFVTFIKLLSPVCIKGKVYWALLVDLAIISICAPECQQNTKVKRIHHLSTCVCQLHRSDSHGHPAEPRAAGHSVGHLRVHHEEISLLPLQPESLAELHQTQPVPQQLLHQGTRKHRGRWEMVSNEQDNKVFLCLIKVY